MIQAIRKVWNKYFGKSFFRKIFLVNLAIILITQATIFALLTKNLVSIKYDQALLMSDQCLSTVNAFLKTKVKNAKSIHSRLYQQPEIWNLLIQELTGPGTNSLSAYQKEELNRGIVQTAYGIDTQFNGILLGSYADDTLYSFTMGNSNILTEKAAFKTWMEKGGAEDETYKIFSSRRSGKTEGSFSLFLLSNVKSADFKEDIGCMGVYFNSMNIRQSYLEYEEYLKGNLYVLDKKGEILYDSSRNYEVDTEFPMEQILSSGKQTLSMGKNIYNVSHSGAGGYYVVNAFPMSEVWKDVKIPQRTMIFIFIMAFIAAVLFNYISTLFFAKRLKPITDTMKEIRKGNLTSFPLLKKYDDEVGYIYTELLRMCSSLDDHIQKEYVYKLQQKEMEMYALQAQINPHFLYNTLEAIRMKLYVKGETEVSKMIWIFSDLFRNIMKKDVILTNREEIAFLRSYLDLFQFRLGGRMKFVLDIEDEVYRYATIKHILQPIVENALVHGIEDAGTEEEPCTIIIQGRKEEQDIFFTISDDGCGIPEEKLKEIRQKLNKDEHFQESIGIYNVNSRLKIVYGPSYGLTVDSREGQGTQVTVRIKALKKKELEKYVQTINC